MIDLREKIKEIIEREKKSGRFSVLNDDSVELLQQILSNYEVTNGLHQDFENIPKKAELVLLAAPTGAGKDSLVVRLNHQNPDKNYVELNMDMFRHYYSKFIKDYSTLNDRTFAEQTGKFSFEMYSVIQEILLTEFPGSNIIITGTLNTTDWIENTFRIYKENEFTDYKIKVVALAVPGKDSAFSIIKRYVSIVDSSIDSKDFVPGTARYTSLTYHNKTYSEFPKKFEALEEMHNKGRYIDCIEVHRRSTKETDYAEDTMEYSSERKEDEGRTAIEALEELRGRESQITQDDIFDLFEMITKHKEYFKEQNVLMEIVHDLAEIFGRGEILKKRVSEIKARKMDGEEPGA